MTNSTPQAAEQAYDIDAYLVFAAQLHRDSPPYLVLEPYDSDHARCTANPGGCTANLIDTSCRHGPVPLGELVQLAVAHENARDGFPDSSATDDSVGEIIEAAHRTALDALYAEGRAELVGRLAAFRLELSDRQQEAASTRETAHGSSAELAAIRADLYGEVIDQLDRVVNG